MHKTDSIYETSVMRAALDLYSLHKDPPEGDDPDEKTDLPDEIRELLRQNRQLADAGNVKKRRKERF